MRLVKTACALAVGLVLGASAMAVAGGSDQQYTGCLAKDGTLYKVAVGYSPTKACARGETQITWSETGPAGTNGTNGVDGTTPEIGANGHWFIGASDTGVAAQGPAGTNGTDGKDGAPGEPGPANLAALNGSACIVNGRTSTLSVSVDPTTGAVSLVCTPMYRVAVDITTEYTLDVTIRDMTTKAVLKDCDGVTGTAACTIDLPSGSYVKVELDRGYFTFACPGYGWLGHGTYYGECAATSLSSDFTVLVEVW